jgi:carbon-monoxide dehydrogenase large subunit
MTDMTAKGATARFGSDDGSLRSEDAPLLTGRGRFTDDLSLPGQLHAVFVRSPHGHAEIRGIDASNALQMPGVRAVYTGADIEAAGLGPIPAAIPFTGKNDTPMVAAPMPVLASGRARYAGEPLAMVVADDPRRAQDAAEAIELDLAPLPALPTVAAATEAGAPRIWDAAPGNVSLDWGDGNAAGVDAAFAGAAHVATVRLVDTRLAPVSMEPRAGIGAFDARSGRFTLIAPTQGVALVRKMMADAVFGVPLEDVRILTCDVGGGFGMKVQAYCEYAAILFAARELGRPVKWANSRLESFLSDTAGRDGLIDAGMAFDADGRILGLRMRNRVGMGAYITTFGPVFATNNTRNCLSSVYAIPAIRIDVEMVFTNAAPLGPYRGAGRPEAILAVERLLDTGARAMRLDPVAIRRRNLIAPAAMPYKAVNGPVYDSGEFEASMDKALKLADWAGFPGRRAAAERRGRLRGIGLCCFLEVAGGILDENADLRFGTDGVVSLRLGVQAMGQSHLTTFTRLVAGRLGVPASAVCLIEGDSDEAPKGWPSVASRSIMMAGSAAHVACDEAVRKGKALAGLVLEAAAADIEFADGVFTVAGTDRSVGIRELTGRIAGLPELPVELAGGMDTDAEFVSPQMSFPNGCHVCEVEIDPETGIVEVVGYAAVDDVGNVLDPMVVEGQIHGGIAQGLGQVLGEQVVYDAEGQLLTGSFMDYVMPRAGDLPALRVDHHSVPCTNNPLGAKGAGESGVAGALPSGMAAVLDALASRDAGALDLPMTPNRVWAALAAAPGARSTS